MALGAANTAWADTQKPPALDFNFSLPAPDLDAHRKYLGIPSDTAFYPGQVSADILLIQIFSMYCPICQREASKTNELYNLIRTTPAYDKALRLVGIGAGNSDFEVAFFKEKYTIEFPLFSDADFEIHQKIGEVQTPFFIGIRPGDTEEPEIFFTHSGEIKDPNAFLEDVFKAFETPDKK